MASRHAHVLTHFLQRVAGGHSQPTDEQLLQRFAAQRDPAAFAALVARHGPMVLGVCCRALRDPNDAEDAFQATFLVLARRARTIARPHLLAQWLYGVARRTALEAKVLAARQQARRRPLVDVATAEPTPQVVWADLRPVLDEEIGRLPQRYRAPFVLCYLEGRTNEEAARLLGCPRGTILSRLAWARARLRSRLTRRGVTLSAGLFAFGASRTAVSPALAGGTTTAALAFTTAVPAGGAVTARAGSLATEVLRHMFFTKASAVAGFLLALCLLIGGGALVWSPADSRADGPQAGAAEGADGPKASSQRSVIVSQPLARMIAEHEEFVGVAEPESVIEIGSRVSGFLVRAPFKVGEAVKRDDLLFEIDSVPYMAQLKQCEAQLQHAEADQLSAEAVYQRVKTRFASQAGAKEALTRAAAVRDLAKAAALRARAARDEALRHLRWTRIDAPIDGTLLRVLVEAGQLVRADGPALATLLSPGPLSVRFEVDREAALRLLRRTAESEGKRTAGGWAELSVAVRPEGAQGPTLPGTVDVARTRALPKEKTLELRAVLPKSDGLRIGQRVRVRVLAAAPARALLVPERAVGTHKGRHVLFVVNPQNVLERRQVELGPIHDGLRVVKAGLQAEDWFVLGGGPRKLRPGMTVTLQKVAVLPPRSKIEERGSRSEDRQPPAVDPRSSGARPTGELSRPEVLARFRNLSPAQRWQLAEKAGGEKALVPVTRGDLDIAVVERGVVEAAEAADIVYRGQGKARNSTELVVIKGAIEDGIRVKKGDRLIELDDSALREQLAVDRRSLERATADKVAAEESLKIVQSQNAADVRQAENDVELAQRAVQTPANKDAIQKEIRKRKAVLEQVKRRTQATEARAAADVQARAAIAAEAAKQKQATEGQLEACIMRAPQDGVVVYYIPEAPRGGGAASLLGQGEAVREGQKLMRILDVKHLAVSVRIPAAFVADVRVGQTATVRIDAFPQRSLRGCVRQVAKTVYPRDWLAGRRVYAVLVDLREPFSRLLPGMTAEVRIEATRKRGVLRVPAEAVVRSGTETFCYVKAKGGLQERQVKTGAHGDVFVEIAEGLHEAEPVLWDPYTVAKRAGPP